MCHSSQYTCWHGIFGCTHALLHHLCCEGDTMTMPLLTTQILWRGWADRSWTHTHTLALQRLSWGMPTALGTDEHLQVEFEINKRIGDPWMEYMTLERVNPEIYPWIQRHCPNTYQLMAQSEGTVARGVGEVSERVEIKVGKLEGRYGLWCLRVPLMELGYQSSEIFDILCWSPLILLDPIPFPSYQVIKFPCRHLALQDVFHYVFFDSIIDYRWMWITFNTFSDGVCIIGSHQCDWEDRMHVAKGRGQLELISTPGDDLLKMVRAKALVVILLHWTGHDDFLSVESYFVSDCI